MDIMQAYAHIQCMHTHTHTRKHADMHTYIHIHLSIYMYRMYTNKFINTYIHTYNNNYVHVGLCKQLSLRDWIYSHQIKVDNNKLKSFSDPEYEFVYIHKLKHSHA